MYDHGLISLCTNTSGSLPYCYQRILIVKVLCAMCCHSCRAILLQPCQAFNRFVAFLLWLYHITYVMHCQSQFCEILLKTRNLLNTNKHVRDALCFITTICLAFLPGQCYNPFWEVMLWPIMKSRGIVLSNTLKPITSAYRLT